jgi:hypothetical protein
MSSFIEWPSIYGSTYFIPAVIVIVLLLALLLLMSSRRRAAAEAARNAAEPLDVAETLPPAPPAEDMQAEATPVPVSEAAPGAAMTQPMAAPAVVTAPLVAAAPSTVAPATAAPVAGAPEVLPAMAVVAPPEEIPPIPDLGRLATGANIRVTVRAKGPVSAVTGNDPLNAALLDILGGWGDLSPEDVKRLELFRPERLAAAVAAIQLPKSKSGEAKARLSQLRQYSADLERRSTATQAAVSVPPAISAVAAAAAMAPAAAPTAAAPDAAPVATPPTADTAAATFPSMDATAGLATAIALGAARRTTPESYDKSSAESSAATGLEATAMVAGTAAVADRSDVDELASFWADPRPVWETDTQVSLHELPAPTYEEVEVGSDGDGAEIRELYPPLTAVPSADVALAGEPEAGEPEAGEPRTHAPLTSVDTFFWDDPPAGSLSRLSVKVETAEQLLALPPEERVEMTAFLGPAELVATFRATNDPDLKKAVIDTLEHISSPASLNALGNCFGDSDSDIQLYALEAADRLLGVA